MRSDLQFMYTSTKELGIQVFRLHEESFRSHGIVMPSPTIVARRRKITTELASLKRNLGFTAYSLRRLLRHP